MRVLYFVGEIYFIKHSKSQIKIKDERYRFELSLIFYFQSPKVAVATFEFYVLSNPFIAIGFLEKNPLIV